MHIGGCRNNRFHHAAERRTVGNQRRAESHAFAQTHYGHAVITDGAGNQHNVAGTGCFAGNQMISQPLADAGRSDVDAVAVSFFHNLGVARHDGNAGFLGRFGHGDHDFLEVSERKTFFENKGRGKPERLSPAHGNVIHRAGHGQPADVAAGKEEGFHDVGVTGNGYRFDDRRHDSAVVALSEPLVGEVFGKEFADQLSRSPSARTVRHVNCAAAHIQPPSKSCTFCLEIMSHCFSPLERFCDADGPQDQAFF